MRKLAVLSLLIMLAACDGASEVDGPGTVAPGDLPPNGRLVASLGTDSASHELFDEGDGCYVHGVSVPGFDTRFRRLCTWDHINFARQVGSCFFQSGSAQSCDATIEPVIYGVIPPPIAHVCLGTFDGPPTLIVDAVVISPPQGVPFIEPLRSERVVPIPFTAEGRFYGEPEIDTDVDLMINTCVEAGPWESSPPEEILLAMIIAPDDIDEVTVFFDFGLGARGFGLPDVSLELYPFDFRLDPTAATFRAAIGNETDIDWVELPIPSDLEPADAVIVIPESLDPREIELRNG